MSTRPIFHVIAISETWLGSKIEDSLISLGEFSVLRQDRNTHGGGVALYIHRSLAVTQLCSSPTESAGRPGIPEYLLCEVTPKGGNPIFVGVVYRPPHTPFIADTDLLPNHFISNLRDLMHNYSSKIILGDFNADQLSNSDDAIFLRNFIEENSLASIPFKATHHTADSNTWLDLCLVDDQDSVVSYWQTATPFIAGHDLITATIDIHVPKPVINDFTYRDFKRVDPAALNQYLNECDWSEITSGDSSLEAGFECLYRNLYAALNSFVPLKTCKFRKNHYPWFTDHHRALLADRDRLYRRYRRSRLPSELLEYRIARDRAHEQIEDARLEFYWVRLRGLTDQRKIWKELRHLGVVPDSKPNITNFNAEELNAHFASVSFDPAAPSLSQCLDRLGEERREDCRLGSFDFSDVLLADLSRAVDRSTSQAIGVDDLPQIFIKTAFPSIGTHLCKLFNRSLASSVFPGRWKQSLVLALNKIPSPGCLGDFRPISLLCFLSKTLERVVYEQMVLFIDSNRLLNPFQSGFRTGHSTQTALLKLTDDIRLGKDKRLLTALILFDFSKAFDSVCHATLLSKLYRLGFSINVLKWIGSYLAGRSQAVKDNDGSLSSFLPLNKGVPQGSVLGPLLFSLFINDIAEDLDYDSRHIVYADDLQVYVRGSFEDLQLTLQKLSRNAERIADWATVNKLSLNVNKTQAIVFGTPKFINRFNELDVKSIPIYNSSVPIVPSVRSLGVVLDAKLNWKEHVLYICKKANRLMYRLNHFRRSTTFPLRKHLIQSLLFPIVDYCSLVYCDISGELDLILQRILNSGIRYIFGVRKSTHITPYRRQLGWLRAGGRRDYFAALQLFKILKNGLPEYLANYFIANVRQRPSRGRDPDPLLIPSFKTESLRKSFHVSSSYLWNSLPTHIRSASSLSRFKHLLHEYIFINEEEH